MVIIQIYEEDIEYSIFYIRYKFFNKFGNTLKWTKIGTPLDSPSKIILFYIFLNFFLRFSHGPAMILCIIYHYKQFKRHIL